MNTGTIETPESLGGALGHARPVVLLIPSDADLQLIVRLSASGFAACAGLDVEQVDDLMTAVAESFHYMISQIHSADLVRIEFARTPSVSVSLYLDGAPRCHVGGYRGDAECVKYVLETLVDDVSVDVKDGSISRIALAKNASAL